MSTEAEYMAEAREFLKASASGIVSRDAQFSTLIGKKPKKADLLKAGEVFKGLPTGGLESAAALPDEGLALETVVQRVGRPVLLVQDKKYAFDDPGAQEEDMSVWRDRLFGTQAERFLLAAIPAIGRVEVENHPLYTWIGTAWLVSADLAITNRHVAQEFAFRRDQRFVIQREMTAKVDFLEEFDRTGEETFVVKDVLFLAEPDGPDMAILKLENPNGKQLKLADPLRLATAAAKERDFVATIGYPAADSRVPDQALVRRFFGDVYNKKRLAPGQILGANADSSRHDCSTLGGNSGSPVISLATGEVVALHFSGLFLRENRAVSAPVVQAAVDRVLRPPRPQTETAKPSPKPQRPTLAESGTNQSAPVYCAGTKPTRFTLQIPIELQLNLGTPSVVGAPTIFAAAETVSVADAVAQVRELVRGEAGIQAVQAGFAYENGWITPRRAVAVVLSDSRVRGSLRIPESVGGFPVEVRDPGLLDLLPAVDLSAAEGVRPTAYQKPTDFSLELVEEPMKVTCHLSPDSGWKVLSEFLGGTKKTLTVGMYDFTAPHIITGVTDAVAASPKKLKLVMQAGESITGTIKKDDWRETEVIQHLTDALGSRFSHAPASVGKDRQFASSYHIKVAVRDGKAFWLSSGNWQSSNQYETNPDPETTSWWHLDKLNREWHVVIENANLAAQFEKFLQYDFDNAAAEESVPAVELPFLVEEALEVAPEAARPAPTYFEPLIVSGDVSVLPLLTPDNYHEEVLKLLESAEEQILFQNQSLNLQGVDNQGEDKNDPRFLELVGTLLRKQKEGVDVRIIMRGDFNPQTALDRLAEFGFDMRRIRLQDRCHTKGIIVDRRTVLVGSHNWTNEGALANRDASLIFHNEEIADYYGKAFWFDWKRQARASTGGRRRVTPVDDKEAPPPPGWAKLSVDEFQG